jgi:predicted small metal-binding protein
MTDVTEYTNRCACGWEVTGPLDDVVDATIDHGRRIHNMEATRDEVVATLSAGADSDEAADLSA